MNISALTLRDLEYLIAVADLRHFGKAAAACHVSQPGLSIQIRKVEDFLGLRLFERSKRSVVITTVGEAVVRQARIVLEEARKITAIAETAAEPLSGSLRLGAIATLGPYLMPHLLLGIRKTFTRLELLMKEGLTNNLISELRSGALDAVLAVPTFNAHGLRIIPLFNEPFLLAVPKDHPLAKKRPLQIKDLHSKDMILLEDGHCLRDQSIHLCPSNRRGSFREFHATSLETLRHLVAGGFGYSLIPQLAWNAENRLKSLVRYRAFEGRPVGRTIVLASRERFGRMPDIDSFAEFIRKSLPRGVTAV